jgi:hypothetical protein
MRESRSFRIVGDLRKVSAAAEADLIKIECVASTESRDHAGEIVLASAIKAAIPDFMIRGKGALRSMHDLIAAGTVDTIEVNEARETVISATVVDPVVIRKVETETLRSLSIGGKVLARDATDRTIITKIRLSEVSLVDVGANPDAGFVLAKVDDDDDDADTIAELSEANEKLNTALTKIAERVEPLTSKFNALAAENQRLAKRVRDLEAEKSVAVATPAPAPTPLPPYPVEMFRKTEGILDDLSDMLDGVMGRVERAERTDQLVRAKPAGRA